MTHTVVTCAIIVIAVLIAFKILKKLVKAAFIGVVAGVVYYILCDPARINNIVTQITTMVSK